MFEINDGHLDINDLNRCKIIQSKDFYNNMELYDSYKNFLTFKEMYEDNTNIIKYKSKQYKINFFKEYEQRINAFEKTFEKIKDKTDRSFILDEIKELRNTNNNKAKEFINLKINLNILH